MKRLKYIDAARGVLILLVIFGHCFPGDERLRFIFSFHTPAFLMISGYLFNKSSAFSKSINANVVNIFRRFLLPFIFFESLSGIVAIATHQKTMVSAVFAPVLGYYNAGADWYLISVAIAEMIFVILHKYMRDKRFLLFISSTCMVLTFLMPHTQLFRVIGRILSSLFFIVLGFYLRFIFENEKNQIRYIIIAFLLTFSSSYFNTAVDIFSLRFGNPLLFLISAISGTHLIISLCRYRFFERFSFFGSLSLTMMGTHQMFLPYVHFRPVVNYMLVLLADIPLALLLNKCFPILTGRKSG